MVEQVGGDHYLAAYQHWDFVPDTNTGYLEGNATKYLGRWRKKHGIEDLDKALSYMQKARQLFIEGRWTNESDFVDPETVPLALDYRDRWFHSANIELADRGPITSCLVWRTEVELHLAISQIQTLKRTAGGLLMGGAPATPSSAAT